MSYDIKLINKKTKNTVILENCNLKYKGGTYKCDDKFNPVNMTDCSFNITYNYSNFFYNYIDKQKGIRFIYNKPIDDVIRILNGFIGTILIEYSDVYYKAINGAQPSKKKYCNILKQHVYDLPKKTPTHTQLKKQEDNFDYWAPTPANVVESVQHIIDCLIWVKSHFKQSEYKKFILDGD